MGKAGRYFRTLRHLRFEQIVGQVRARIQQRVRDPARILTKVPTEWSFREGTQHGFTRSPLERRGPLRGEVCSRGGEATHPTQRVPPSQEGMGEDTPHPKGPPLSRGDCCGLRLAAPVPGQDPAQIAAGRFTFVGQACDLGGEPDWEAPGRPRLWQYNLHYFDWLWSLLPGKEDDWKTARRLTLDWIERHPPARGACGWEPYPTSLRLINWALLFGVRRRELVVADPAFEAALLQSVAGQARWLEMNLETHIQANHLLENLAALACVGSVFCGAAAEQLLGRILPLLRREIAEQILPDGMHYERSPMYHLRILWLVEMLSEAWANEVQSIVRDLREPMKLALACLRHPDGEIAQFNDAAIGIYSDGWREEKEIQFGAWALPEAGYYGYRDQFDNYVVIDAGPVGPDHQPGHAHADFLSFELSLGGRRVITDTGIGTYERGKQREYERSTAAHNTVMVDGEDSVEVWGSFRVGRRVKPRVIGWAPAEDGFVLEAEHDGYRHLPSAALHRRTLRWRDGALMISDRVSVRREAQVVSRIHLAPGVEARVEGRKVFCAIEEVVFIIEAHGQIEVGLDTTPSFPAFGRRQDRTAVVVRGTAGPPCSEWNVSIHPSVPL